MDKDALGKREGLRALVDGKGISRSATLTRTMRRLAP
jgi:hypothetical protein